MSVIALMPIGPRYFRCLYDSKLGPVVALGCVISIKVSFLWEAKGAWCSELERSCRKMQRMCLSVSMLGCLEVSELSGKVRRLECGFCKG